MKPRNKIGVGVVLLGVLVVVVAFFSSIWHRIPLKLKPVARVSVHGVNDSLVGVGISLLKSGNIVLRMGKGADSYMLSQFNRRDKSYSHCGIVFIENGYPFVYHAIGGEDNPDERLRRDSASFFFSPAHNFAFGVVDYHFDSAQENRLRNAVLDYYKKRPLFDLKFDLGTDDKLYCAEFVFKALNKAANNDTFIGTSSVMGFRFAGVDDLFLNPHCKIIWQTKFK